MINPRVPLNRLTAGIAVAILVLSLVLTGGSGAAAQAPDPGQHRPATPEELAALEQAIEINGDVVTYPPSTGGYPVGMPEAPEVAAAAGINQWTANWATGALCSGNERCLVGDFNGDKRDDAAVIRSDNTLWVALAKSTGGFVAAVQWAPGYCLPSRICKVGDFNADGKDDVVIFDHGANESAGTVWVILSQGGSFGALTVWQNLFCIRTQVCEVGNFDGILGDDIIVFWRSDVTAATGRVDVAVALANGGFSAARTWHNFFCILDEECRVADMNGDGRDDITAFIKTGTGAGRMPVAISAGSLFGTATDWSKNFCYNPDTCTFGDFDGDGRADALKFIRSSANYGEPWVGISSGSGLGDPVRWKTSFCGSTDECAAGDFNGDGRTDIIRFVKQSVEPSLVGAAYVAMAGGEPFGFVPTPAETGGKWLDGFCKGSTTTCATGDFNGDGLTDVVHFTRATSGSTLGDVYVSLNVDGTHFGPQLLWLDFGCLGADVCKIGDIDHDGKDDLITFSRQSGSNGWVFVSRSTGIAFEAGLPWVGRQDLGQAAIFCVGSEICDVGDFNGDGFTDIILFIRSAYGNIPRAGDVEVAINLNGRFVPVGLWHNFFCLASETCQVGDFNGDGRDDIISFVKSTTPTVWVALSNGIDRFGDKETGELWHNFFCASNEVCAVGDPNGDGKDDILTFVQTGYPTTNPASPGDVFVGISQGSQAAGGFISQKWQEFFCFTGEVCGTGFFNHDNREDIIAFKHDNTTGAVWVALAGQGNGFFFEDAIPAVLDVRLHLPFVMR